MNERCKFDCNKLSAPIKMLSCYVALFYSEKTDDIRCEILADKILPLLEKISPDLHKQWLEEKEEHVNASKLLYEKALADIKNVFSVLRQRVVSAGLLENEKIKQSVCIADARFEFRPASENAFIKNSPITGKPEWICFNCGRSKEIHRVWALPSYVHCLYKAVQFVCNVLVDLRREDLINDYAEIEYVERYRWVPKPPKKTLQEYFCADCCWIFNDDSAPKDKDGNPIPFDGLDKNWKHPNCEGLPRDFHMYQERISCTEPLLLELTFFASLRKFEDHRNFLITVDKKPSEVLTWVAYETLWRIKWALETPRDYFRKKGLRFKNPSPVTCEKSASILGLHSLWSEIKTSQNKNRNKNKKKRKYTFLGEDNKSLELSAVKDVPFFLNKERVNQSLSVILKEIGAPLEGISCECDYLLPLNIELCFKLTHYLCLRIEWAPGLFEILQIHSFQDINANIRHDFIKELYENPERLVSMDTSDASGISAKQYLERIGITGVLDKLFIAQKTGTGAILSAKHIDLTKASTAIRKKVRKYIQELKTFKRHP